MKSALRVAVTTIVIGMAMLVPSPMAAHCDTLGGPVIAAAKLALKTGDVTRVLKWVKPEHEAEIRNAFARTMKVRNQGPEAQELADSYFFETLVRVHRAGEGAPYTGIKAEPVEPPIAATDKALETGSVEPLVKMVTNEIANGIRQRFAHTAEVRKHADDSVAAGREYVTAYVELTHYVEGLHKAGSGADLHGGDTHVAMKEAH